ncbi:uncharacterized protein [Panulirus ornatus]
MNNMRRTPATEDMEDPTNSASEVQSDSEAEHTDPDSDDSDLYGDLESSLSQRLPQNVSGDSDVDDSDIFTELGMPVDHGSPFSKCDVTQSCEVSSEANKESITDDMKNEVSGNDCIKDYVVPKTAVPEKRNVKTSNQSDGDVVASETNVSVQTLKKCKDKMIEWDSDKCRTFENVLATTAALTEQVGFGKKVNATATCGSRERCDRPLPNKEVQFILSCLAREKGSSGEKSIDVNVNASISKQNGDWTLNKSAPSVSDTDKLSTVPESVRYTCKSRERDKKSTENFSSVNETLTNATDVNVSNRISSQASSVEERYLTTNKTVCAADFMMNDESGKSFRTGPVKSTKRLRRKSELKDKADSQMDLFEDFLVGRDRDELAQEVARLKLEKETLEKQLDESQNRCIDLESDNEILLSNISALWKTAMSQLRKKCSELAMLKREKEAIIFRRAMRQVPKDELDHIISRIAAYNKDEFCTFMKNLQEDEKGCAFGNVTSASVEKLSLTQRIKLNIRGTRVQSSSDIEAHALQIMLGKQGKRVAFSTEEVYMKKIKSSKDHTDFENRDTSLDYQEDKGQHKAVTNSRYSKKSNSTSSSRVSQRSFIKNTDNIDTYIEHQKFDTHDVKKLERSVFSRLGVRKSLANPDGNVSVCDVRDILKEKQNRKQSRPHETQDIHLHNSKELVSNNTKHTPIYYREPKDNEGLKDNSVSSEDNVVEGKHLQNSRHREKKSVNFASAEVEIDHDRKRETVDWGTIEKDSATMEKYLRPESPELHTHQYEVRDKASSTAQKENIDTSDQDDEMLTKSLYGQRMIARLKNLSKPRTHPHQQPVVPCSLQSLAEGSGLNADSCYSSQSQDVDGEIDCNIRTVMLPKIQKVDEEFDTVAKSNRVIKGNLKKVTLKSKNSDQKSNRSETNNSSGSVDDEKLVFCPSYSGSCLNECGSGKSLVTEGEEDGNLIMKMLPSTQKIVKENDVIGKKTQVTRRSVKRIDCNESKSIDQREDVFETNYLSEGLSSKLVSCSPHSDVEERRGTGQLLYDDGSENSGYDKEEDWIDESTETRKDNKTCLATDANKKRSCVAKDFISKDAREERTIMRKEKSEKTGMEKVSDLIFLVSNNIVGTELKEQDGKLPDMEKSYKEPDIERKISEISKMEEGRNRIVRLKKKSGISEVNKQSTEISTTENLNMLSEVNLQESEEAVSDAALGKRSDRKLNEKQISKIIDGETLIEAEGSKTSNKDERNLQISLTQFRSKSITDVDTGGSRLKKEKIDRDSSLLKEAKYVSNSKEKTDEFKSKEKKVKSKESEDRRDKKSDEDNGRSSQHQEGKVRDMKNKQRNAKTKEEGRNDDIFKKNERSDFKSTIEGRQTLKSKEKEGIYMKSLEEGTINVRSHEEEKGELESGEEETDVKSKEEERKDFKSKEKWSSRKLTQDGVTYARIEKGEHCVKLRKTEKSHMKPRQDKTEIDNAGERKDMRLKQKERKVGKSFKEERTDEKSQEVELRMKSKQKNVDVSKVLGDFFSGEEKIKKKSKRLRDVDTEDRDGKPKEGERRDMKSKIKGKDGESKDKGLKENMKFVLFEEMQGRDRKSDEVGYESLVQNDALYSEDCNEAQDSRDDVWDRGNFSLGNEVLREDGEAYVNDSQELQRKNEAPEECSRNMKKQKCRESTFLKSYISRKLSKEEIVGSERKEEILASSESMIEEIKRKDCKAVSDCESDAIDILCDKSDRDIENCFSGDESEIYNNKRNQGKRMYETKRTSNASDDSLHLTYNKDKSKGETQEMEEHDSETEGIYNESEKCVFQVSEMQDKDYIDNENLRIHSDDTEGQGENSKAIGNYISIHLNDEIMKESDDLNVSECVSDTRETGWGNHNEGENKKDSVQNREYAEESIFPEEEELLYDEGTDDSDENEPLQDLHEPDAKSTSKVSSVEGALFGSHYSTKKADVLLGGKMHDHEKIDMNLKNDSLNSKKVNPETLTDIRANEQLTKEECKHKSVHDRLSYKMKSENDEKKITSLVMTSPRKESKIDYRTKTLRSRHRYLQVRNEEEIFSDEKAINNSNRPRSFTSKKNDTRSSKSRSRSRSGSPRKECQSEIRSGRIRKLPQSLNCKYDQRSGESQSPLMEKENRLQEKKNALRESPHKRENDIFQRTRINRQQRKRTERSEESPLLMLSQRPESSHATQCKHSNIPSGARATRYQTRKKEHQTDSVVHGKQDGSSPRNKEERISLKRKERQGDWEELQSKRRKMLVKGHLSKPRDSNEENDDCVEARRYHSSPPELERRRSSRLRNLSGERRHKDDSLCSLPEREICSGERRKALRRNEVVQQHNDKETKGIKDGMKINSARSIRVDSKLLQNALAQSPSKYSVEENEKEEGELDDDDVDEEDQISIASKLIMGYNENHTLNKEEELTDLQSVIKEKGYQSEIGSSQQENETNQKCLREKENHQHEILKGEEQFTRESNRASRLRNNVSINEQRMASVVNSTHEIGEETDNYAIQRECRMKALTDSLEVKSIDRKHRSESRNLGSLVEDATFFPADLFQVVHIQGDTNRMNLSSVTGPSSGSDDTIDMIVKRHNEKYASDNMNSSDDSEMSLLQFIADDSDENSDDGENEGRKNNLITQEATARNVNDDTLHSIDLTAKEVCDKEDCEIGTEAVKTNIILRKVDDIIKSHGTGPMKPRLSSTVLPNKTPTMFNIKEMEDTFVPAGEIQSSNGRSTPVLNSDYTVEQDNQRNVEGLGNEGKSECDKSSSFESPSSSHIYSNIGVRQNQIHRYDKCEKEPNLNVLCSNTEIDVKDSIQNSTNEGDITNDITLIENETETVRYHLNVENELAGGAQDDGAIISPSTHEEPLHPEQYTKSIAASEANDGASSSSSDSDSDSGSDCLCSKCGSSSSSSSSSSCCSSSSGSDTDAENDVIGPPRGTNLHLETVQEHNVVDTQTPLTFIEECDELRNGTPSPLHNTSSNKVSCESTVRVSQKSKPLKSLPKTPKKSPHKDRETLYQSAKMPLKSPHKSCKTPCKKIPHKSPCKKTPHKTPCKKTPHKTPCKKSPKTQCKKTPHKVAYRKTGKRQNKSPKSSSTETSLDISQNATPNTPSSIPGDASPTQMVPDKTFKEKEVLSIVKVTDTETGPKHRLSSIPGVFPENLKGRQYKSIVTEDKSCDRSNEEQCTTVSVINLSKSQTISQHCKRRAASFRPRNTSQVKLSCVSINSTVSIVHSREEDSKTLSSEKTLKKSVIASQAGLGTPVKEKRAYSPKCQLSPVSYETEENAVRKKMKVLSPEMFSKVSHRLPFPEVGNGEKIADKDLDKSLSQSCESGSSVTSSVKLSASNNLVVPIRIRRAKRQLNLGLSGSSENVLVVMAADLCKNNKSSPEKDKYRATKTTPKTDLSKKRVSTVLRRSPRKSPRKLSKYS